MKRNPQVLAFVTPFPHSAEIDDFQLVLGPDLQPEAQP
jgi:hypothetical protein